MRILLYIFDALGSEEGLRKNTGGVSPKGYFATAGDAKLADAAD
jgi:hypothetical protein